MNKNADGCIGIRIPSPLTGATVPLEEASDSVLPRKIIGDGVAILPQDSNLVSPTDAEVVPIAEIPHAYDLRPENGIEAMIHSDLETVALKGKYFRRCVKVGDKVKAGEPLAKVDLKAPEEKQVNTVTPILICGGMEGCPMNAFTGPIKAGTDVAITALDHHSPSGTAEAKTAALQNSDGASAANVSSLTDTADRKIEKTRKSLINFGFLQELGKVLMTVITVIPAVGLMISVGKPIQMAGGDMGIVLITESIMKTIGWAVINNLYTLFAIAIGDSWAKERAGGALAVVTALILISVITGALFGVGSADLNDSAAVTRTLLGREILANGYFTSVLGAPALDVGAFVGIISGFVGGVVYNKYYNYRKLPDALAFFNGKRFVSMVVTPWSVIILLALSIARPAVQTGINSFGVWITNSPFTPSVLAPFIYGTLKRLLLLFGLRRMLIIPMNYTPLGGTYTVLTDVSTDPQASGQNPLWLAWTTDLISLKDAGNIAGYQNLMAAITPARSKAGRMIGATGLLLGITLAMYRHADPDKCYNYYPMSISTVLAVFLTGVMEPLEFMFMFCVLPLYLVHAVLQGCAFAMVGLIHLRLHSFDNLEFLTRVPMSIRAGLGGDLVSFTLCVAVFFAVGYTIAYFMIERFHFATPGRLGNYTDDPVPESSQGQTGSQSSGNSQAERITFLLGGRDNIVLTDACMARLHVTVKNVDKVAELSQRKAGDAMGLIKKDGGIQVVYGSKVDVFKPDINDIL